MRRPGFGWKICWMRTAGSGWWTRDWRHLRLRGTSLACAYSMPGRFTPASESSWPRTKTRLRSALRRRHAAGPCRCDTRLRPHCMAIASGLTPRPDRQIWICSKLLLACGLIAAAGTSAAQSTKVDPVISRDLAGMAGKEGVLLVVEYAPGAVDP